MPGSLYAAQYDLSVLRNQRLTVFDHRRLKQIDNLIAAAERRVIALQFQERKKPDEQ